MKLYFNGTTNGEYIYINTISFRLMSGKIITIDRDESFYSINKDGLFTMEWKNIYIWDKEEPTYLYNEKDLGLFKDALIESVDIEDDAPEGYTVKITGWHF